MTIHLHLFMSNLDAKYMCMHNWSFNNTEGNCTFFSTEWYITEPSKDSHINHTWENLHMLAVSVTGLSFTYPGTQSALRGKLETINFYQFTCSWISVMWYHISTDLICLFVCVRVKTQTTLPFNGSITPAHYEKFGKVLCSGSTNFNKVNWKTFQYHKEPNKDRRHSGRFYGKQQLGVCANIILMSSFPRPCNRISRYLGHWSGCSLLYSGHNRLLCRRYKAWLHRWRTEWDQFISGCVSSILNGRCFSRNMLLITCSCRHRAEIWPQHIEQSQHTL